jgi:RHS repeat-associated protein
VIAAQAFEYTAFGDLISSTTPDTRYLYTGQQYDSATDLYSLRARYYDAGVGRFVSRDTWAYNFESPVELNRHVYVAGSEMRLSRTSRREHASEENIPN